MQEQENKALDLNNSKSLTLEKFLVKLCSNHKKQFIHVLNNLSTEEPLEAAENQRPPDSDLKDADENDRSTCARKSDISLSESASAVCIHSSRKPALLENAANSFEMETNHSPVSRKLNCLLVPSDSKDDSATNCLLLQNCTYAIDCPEQTLAKNHLCVKRKSEPPSLALDEVVCPKKPDVASTAILDCGILSHNNSTLSLLHDAQDCELSISVPKNADKENTQYISPKKACSDKDTNDCKLKQENSLQSIVIKKLEHHFNHCDKAVENLGDDPKSRIVRSHDITKHPKAVKCKNTTCARKTDHDKQCDIVYVNETIAAECNIENQKSVCSRNTARKSTRGYLFGGDCCEVSTVRTLVKSSTVEDKHNSALHISEALIIPNRMVSEALHTTDIVSMIHVGENRVEEDLFTTLPKTETIGDLIPASPRCSISGPPIEQIQHLVKQSVDSKSLLAVISLVDNDSDKAHFPRIQSAKEQLPNGHPTQLNALVCGPLMFTDEDLCISRNESGVTDFPSDLLTDDKALSEVSSSQEGIVQSLDVDSKVASANKPLSSNFSENLPSDGLFLSHSAVENVSATFQTTGVCVSSCPSPSTLNGTKDNVEGLLGPSHLSTSESFHDNLDVTHVQESLMEAYSEPISDYISEENPAANITSITESDALKTNQNSLTLLSNLQECPEQTIDQENVSIKTPERLGHLNESKTIANIPYLFSDTELETIQPSHTELETIQPLHKELNDSAPARSCTKDVNTIFYICAKTNIKVELQDDLKEDAQHHDSVNTFSDQHDKVMSLESKANHFDMTDVAMLNLPLVANKHIKEEPITPPKRKVKRPPTPSDRRLRSRETHADFCTQKNTSLQIHVSCLPSTNTHRAVEIKNEDSLCSPFFHTDLPADERTGGENSFGHFLSNQGKPLLSERMVKDKCYFTCNMPENIKTHVEMGSNKRKVYFAVESNNDSITVKERKSNAKRLKKSCLFDLNKSNKQIPASRAYSVSCSKSSIKHVPVKALTNGMKFCRTKILNCLSKDNNRQPSRYKKSASCHPQQDAGPLNNLQLIEKGDEKYRPKFMEWCSEEDNRDRISNFNNKYMSIHKNWISLEKETSNITKSKNKADKLKEIWKTKKRARKSKGVQETPKCSPMQTLFMNSLKVPDICRWFMETTETKSLVIVKKINTRIPEEHQLPIIPLQRPSKQSLYPHTLQAERLKKHLKKFASCYPARNNIKTQNAIANLVENKIKLEVPEEPVARRASGKKLEPKICTKKPSSAHIVGKCNHLLENLHRQSAPVREKKVESVVSKTNQAHNKKTTSKLSSQTKPPPSKYAIIGEKPTTKKRPKDGSSIKHVAQLSKKRKVETKEVFIKNRQLLSKNALAAKNGVRKLNKPNLVSKTRVSKKLDAELRAGSGAALSKASTKTPKHSRKRQRAGQQCQTRSAKSQQIPSKRSRQKITCTSSSQPRKKESHRNVCTISTKSKRKNVSCCKQRSQTDSATLGKR